MRKAIITVFLLITVSALFAFIILYIGFNFMEPSNQINQVMRKQVLRYPILRKIFRLNQIGDARYEYMYSHKLPLEVFLYYQEGVSLEQKTLDILSRDLLSLTHRYIAMTVHPPKVLQGIPDKVSDADISAILDNYGTDSPLLAKTVPLHIFLLKYYTPHPSYAGLVIDAHSLMLFKEPIVYVSEDESSPYAVEISTILHEFAHLLGAEHIEKSDCILADTVENLNFFNKIQIRDSYCDEDMEAIDQALK